MEDASGEVVWLDAEGQVVWLFMVDASGKAACVSRIDVAKKGG